MTLSSEDLFGRQRQTWASCPDWVQTIILKNIRETIKAKIQKEHRIREDRCEGFTDDWAAVAAEVQSQPSSLPPPCGTPRIQSQLSSRPPPRGTPRIHSQTSSNLRIGTLAGALDNRNDSQETVASSDFSQASATRLLTFLDSDLQTPDGSQQVAVGLTLENTVTPTTLRHLALSLDDLEPPEEAAADSELWDIEQEQGVSSDACS
jgi:hypothetical protein